MGLLMDSDVLIKAEKWRGRLEELTRAFKGESVAISVITASELLHGVWRASDARIRAARSAFVENILASFPVIDIDLETARLHAELWADLAGKGQMIGLHDAWIAATCLAREFTLVTCNMREFHRVKGLKVENWS